MRGVIGVAILMFYVLAGLIRLAWFNVMEEQRQEETAEKRECYQGLPITSMAIALPLVVVLKPFLGCEFMLALHVVMLVVGILFITNFKLKKPKNVTMGAIVAVGGSTVVLLLEPDKVLPDSDLIRNTLQGAETIVKMGERIGGVI